MKIISATCNLAEVSSSQREKYLAVVVIEDEGLKFTGRDYDDEPQRAIHCAFSSAATQVTQKLHDSLRLSMEVKF